MDSPNGLPVVYVGRPSKWGNPYRVGDPDPYAGKMYGITTPEDAVHFYRYYLKAHPELQDAARTELKGKNLACWCKPGELCHGDVLLAVANEGKLTEPTDIVKCPECGHEVQLEQDLNHSEYAPGGRCSGCGGRVHGGPPYNHRAMRPIVQLTEKALSDLGFHKIIWNDVIPGYWLGIGKEGDEMWPRLEVRFNEYKGEPFCVWIIGTSWMVPLKHIKMVEQVKQLYALLSGREIDSED